MVSPFWAPATFPFAADHDGMAYPYLKMTRSICPAANLRKSSAAATLFRMRQATLWFLPSRTAQVVAGVREEPLTEREHERGRRTRDEDADSMTNRRVDEDTFDAIRYGGTRPGKGANPNPNPHR